MSQINVYYLSLKKETPNNDYWDYGLINSFIDGELWRTTNFPKFIKQEVNTLQKDDKAIVILPARHHKGLEQEVNKQLNKISKVAFVSCGDEEAEFNQDLISHNNILHIVQNPHPGLHDKYVKIGTGYPPQSKQHHKNKDIDKDLDLFFSGQITHKRRQEMIDAALIYETVNKNVYINRTQGFTQGLDHPEYYSYMRRSKVVPCPSGAVIPDSFRLFEALESMSIPIADEVNPTETIKSYWDWLFNDNTPFPKIIYWQELGSKVEEELANYPLNVHKQTAWWINKKREFAYRIVDFLNG